MAWPWEDSYAWEGPLLRTDPPYYVSAEDRRLYAGYVGQLKAWGRFIDGADRAVSRLVAAGVTGARLDAVRGQIGQLKERWGEANGYALAAHAAAVRANAFPPGSQSPGMGDFSFTDAALAVTAIGALVVVAFFGATLSPFVAAAVAIAGLVSAISLALSGLGETVGDISRDLGPAGTVGLGMGLLLLGGFALFVWSKRKRGR